ncbi:Uncharacterised protein [BD1-7 clade bacterium]|uniref:Acyl-coenzyme A thioesterase THEM4 n=1 Tax=BD1-7 clade bacterium TaxID=2029982 RepID=A0A5S9PXX0_9GAMM|nr:Uncharacterised protein [BD1-7 clade bacterium]CAA0109518.1 Uncharacterised protein [BD1-7 clade bacterium]
MSDSQSPGLNALVAEARQLIDFCVENTAPENALLDAAQTLAALNKQLSTFHGTHTGKERPHKNFNFAIAKQTPQDILPYSPITGEFNPIAPPVQVNFDENEQVLSGTVICGRAYEGPPHCVHGAVIAGIYDQLLAMASACCEKAGPTAYLTTNFKRPTPLYTEITFSAWVAKAEGRKITIKGQCVADGEILSDAEALFIAHQG